MHAFNTNGSGTTLFVPFCGRGVSLSWTNWEDQSIYMTSVPRTGNEYDDHLDFIANKPISRYYHYPVDIPTNVTAYYGKELSVSEGVLTLEKIKTTHIPAGTAVLLYYKDGEAKSDVTISESETEDYTPIEGNVLKGSITDTYVGEGGTILTLGYKKESTTDFGFYKKEDFTAKANRAYLTYDQVKPAEGGSSSAQGITITMDDPTGINEVPAWQQPAVGGTDKVYRLDGTYEPEPQKGVIYIVNGKTIIYL